VAETEEEDAAPLMGATGPMILVPDPPIRKKSADTSLPPPSPQPPVTPPATVPQAKPGSVHLFPKIFM